MEVAAALLDASRKLSTDNKDASTGNVSVGSGSSWNSSNEVRSETVC